ncbi:MAG: hypothetical protein GY696_23660 [Gammaproteobacteria bacterium]|nr:hypothetical protein [Gammaproteobacteria bacterium]
MYIPEGGGVGIKSIFTLSSSGLAVVARDANLETGLLLESSVADEDNDDDGLRRSFMRRRFLLRSRVGTLTLLSLSSSMLLSSIGELVPLRAIWPLSGKLTKLLVRESPAAEMPGAGVTPAAGTGVRAAVLKFGLKVVTNEEEMVEGSALAAGT